VLNDDSIFTGQGAQAYLTFNDGTKVYVKQNSLIKIHVDPKTGAIDLDLKRGGFLIQVNPNSKISVKLDEKHTEVLAQNGIQQEFSSENHLTDPPMVAMSVLPPVERAPAQLIDPAPTPAPAPKVAKNTAKPRAVKRKPLVKAKPVAVAAATPALPSQDVNALKVSAATPEPAPAPEAEATGPQSMFKNITKANSVRSVSTPDDYPFDSLARVAYLYSPGNPSVQGAVSISAWLRKILINSHDYQPGGRPLKFQTTVGEEKKSNIHLTSGTSQNDFVTFRKTRDATLSPPRLLNPSLDWNLGAHQIVKK
jgi:hypothetical protein